MLVNLSNSSRFVSLSDGNQVRVCVSGPGAPDAQGLCVLFDYEGNLHKHRGNKYHYDEHICS